MKVRAGFISNSSSASFIVAVKMCQSQDGSPNWFDVLKILIDNKGGDKLKSFSSGVAEQLKVWNEEVKELEADRKWCVEQFKIYEEMEAVKAAIPLLAKLLRHDVDRNLPKYDKKTAEMHDKNRVRCAREYGEREATEVLEGAKERLNYDIARIDKEIVSLANKIEKAKDYNSKDWSLLGFTEDLHWDFVAKAVKKLEARGQAVILEKDIH